MNHCLHFDKLPRSFSSESGADQVPDGNPALNHLGWECQAVYFPAGVPGCPTQVVNCTALTQPEPGRGAWDKGQGSHNYLSPDTKESDPMERVIRGVERPCHEV